MTERKPPKPENSVEEEILESEDTEILDEKKLKAEIKKLKTQLTKEKKKKAKYVIEEGEKLGNINGTIIYCKHDCPRCPRKKKKLVAVNYIRDKETGLVKDITCRAMAKSQ